MSRRPPTSYVALGEKTSPRWCMAFRTGCGGDIVGRDTLAPGDVALFGSPKLWPILSAARAAGRAWYYGDHAYFPHLRGRYYRITRNAYQHDGDGAAPLALLDQHGVTVAPWTLTGEHVLVCPPSRTFAGLMGFDAQQWLLETYAAIRAHTDRPIRIREKPADRSAVPPLGVDLAGAWAVVTYMSAAAVEAVLAGIPAYVLGPAAARSLGNTDLATIEAPVRAEGREQWAANLLAQQWTLDEMRRGQAWAVLQ